MVELQATAEHQVFDDAQLAKLITFAKKGVHELIAQQKEMLKGLTVQR
jgi:ribonuclease PH